MTQAAVSVTASDAHDRLIICDCPLRLSVGDVGLRVGLPLKRCFGTKGSVAKNKKKNNEQPSPSVISIALASTSLSAKARSR